MQGKCTNITHLGKPVQPLHTGKSNAVDQKYQGQVAKTRRQRGRESKNTKIQRQWFCTCFKVFIVHFFDVLSCKNRLEISKFKVFKE